MGFLTRQLKKATGNIKVALDANCLSRQKSDSFRSSAYEPSLGSFSSHFAPQSCQTIQTQNVRDFPTENENEMKELVITYLANLPLEEYYDVLSQASKMRNNIILHKANKKSATEVTGSNSSSSVSLNALCQQDSYPQATPFQSLLLKMSMKREEETETTTTALQLRCTTKRITHSNSLDTLDETTTSKSDSVSSERRRLMESPLLRKDLSMVKGKSSTPPSRMATPTAFNLLNSVFPAESLTKLKWEMGNTIAKQHANASVFFSDIVGFTDWCSSNSPSTVIECLSAYFQILDDLAEQFGVYKVETIGDAWMGVCGAPNEELYHADIMGHFALEVLETLQDLKEIFQSTCISMRIGLHCGPVVSGVVRADRPRWQLFGDTVNMASRMESTGLPGHIQISRDMYNALKQSPRTKFMCEYRGEMEIKGKGAQDTFFLKDLEIERISQSGFPTPAMFHIEQDRLTIFNPESDPGVSYGKFSFLGCSTRVERLTIPILKEVTSLEHLSSLDPRQRRRSLSRAADPSTRVRVEDQIEAAKYLRQKSILLVDTNTAIIMQFRRVLKKTGLAIYTARDSYEALSLLKERLYIIVYMDLDIALNGFQCVIQQFREWEQQYRTRTQAIFAMLGDKSNKVEQQHLSALGLDGFINKDGNRETILKQVSRLRFSS